MEKSKKIFVVIVLITIILITVSIIFLPDSVRIQHSSVMGSTTYVPKAGGIVLATLLSLGGTAGTMMSKKEEDQKYYPLVISVLGVGLFVYMLVFNFIF